MFIADIDGETDELLENLAKSSGAVFDAIFEHVTDPPPTPVASNSDTFLKWVKPHQVKPLTTYSACGDNWSRRLSLALPQQVLWAVPSSIPCLITCPSSQN
jgi:hypothetical protein